MRIRAVKIQLLNVNEDSLTGTQRLTVLQNITLTAELEY